MKLSKCFDEEEKLFRAVRPVCNGKIFIENGKISSAAFKDKKGLSVDRQGYREINDCLKTMKQKFEGIIVSVLVNQCNKLQIKICYCPSKNNEYHTELHQSDDERLLSDIQAYCLAKLAVIENDCNS